MRQDILEAIDYKAIILADMEDAHALADALDCDGSLHEIIDSYICIYTYDLRKWSVKNWEFVEEALEEGLCEGVSDYHKLIQMGQYVALKGEAYDIVKSIYDDFNDEVTS
tara:strand:+ start:178 stop:507 length:330 start_codon:yes stop_codon:yes gene_type:complete